VYLPTSTVVTVSKKRSTLTSSLSAVIRKAGRADGPGNFAPFLLDRVAHLDHPEQWYVVDGDQVLHAAHMLGRDVADNRDLLLCSGLDRLWDEQPTRDLRACKLQRCVRAISVKTRAHDFREHPEPAEHVHGRLRRPRLWLAVRVRHSRNVEAREVGVADVELGLPRCLDERRGLDVADGPAELMSAVSETGPNVRPR
jgi:hypothetical protein